MDQISTRIKFQIAKQIGCVDDTFFSNVTPMHTINTRPDATVFNFNGQWFNDISINAYIIANHDRVIADECAIARSRSLSWCCGIARDGTQSPRAPYTPGCNKLTNSFSRSKIKRYLKLKWRLHIQFAERFGILFLPNIVPLWRKKFGKIFAPNI